MLGQGGARLAKNIQEHVFMDVPHPGNMLAVRGGYTRMRLRRQCNGNEPHESPTPPPPTKGCRQPDPKKMKNSVNFFRAQKWFCLRSQPCFFFTKRIRSFFHNVAKGFGARFSRFFCTFFRTIFRTVFLAEFSHVPFMHFSNTFAQSCVLPKGFSYFAASALRNCPRDRSCDYLSIKPITLDPILP